MRPRTKSGIAFAFVMAVVSLTAHARDESGALALILTPNNGVPAIIIPGGSFDARLRRQASLKLLSEDTAFDLDAAWRDCPDGTVAATVRIPDEVSPGPYTLEAAADAQADWNVRAVYVFAAFPSEYRIAHVTDTHAGRKDSPVPAKAAMKAVFAAVNRENPALTLVTGDLTHDGTPEQFLEFLEALDQCQSPTFVCPGNHDRTGLTYENVFGPLTYAFRFGEDGFLGFDTKDFRIADEIGVQDGELEVLRRALKPSRWSIGFTHRYDPGMGMRAQLILFVDNPLDRLLFGHYHRTAKEDEDKVPWGTTAITMTPAALDGAFRMLSVSPQRIEEGPVIQVEPKPNKR